MIEGVCLEEVCDGEEQAFIPFKIRYLFRKNPCEKCLVRPACTNFCELKHDYREQGFSVRHMKNRLKDWMRIRVELTTFCFIVATLIFILLITA